MTTVGDNIGISDSKTCAYMHSFKSAFFAYITQNRSSRLPNGCCFGLNLHFKLSLRSPYVLGRALKKDILVSDGRIRDEIDVKHSIRSASLIFVFTVTVIQWPKRCGNSSVVHTIHN